MLYNVAVPGPPTCLHLFYNDGGENGDEILYGTADGKVGLVQLTRQGPHTRWLLEPDSANRAGASGGFGAPVANVSSSTSSPVAILTSGGPPKNANA